jgi:hypothetical protein
LIVCGLFRVITGIRYSVWVGDIRSGFVGGFVGFGIVLLLLSLYQSS